MTRWSFASLTGCACTTIERARLGVTFFVSVTCYVAAVASQIPDGTSPKARTWRKLSPRPNLPVSSWIQGISSPPKAEHAGACRGRLAPRSLLWRCRKARRGAGDSCVAPASPRHPLPFVFQNRVPEGITPFSPYELVLSKVSLLLHPYLFQDTN